MLRMKALAAALLLATCSAAALAAAPPAPSTEATKPAMTPEQKQYVAQMKVLLDSLHPQTGDIAIPDAKATLHLGDEYYFLPADEAKRVLTEGWGNPPDAVGHVLGMVFPAGKTFMDNSWGAVVTYEATGYVADDDAKTADYDDVLGEMQAGEKEGNEELVKAGYEEQHIVGWAQQPTYDAASHSLIWARDIRFGNQQDHGLNYDVRLLGRYGVLSLNMVSTMSHLAEIRGAASGSGKAASFDTGSRYADYQPGVDKKAEFGLAGLVAAGAGLAAAKKLGLLGVILAFGKKFLVLLLAAGGAIVAWFRRKFGGGEAQYVEEPAEEPAEEQQQEA